MGRNPDWHAQIRARGICYICRLPMPDNNTKLAHYECGKLTRSGMKHKEIRKLKNGINRTN